VRLGAQWTRRFITALFAVALLAPLAAGLVGWVPRLAALPLLVVTMVPPVLRAAASREPGRLVEALQRTAVIEVWWALLWTLGLLL
jgi:1,4-dihydroxy-2-naphthoate octaprenyltransferase